MPQTGLGYALFVGGRPSYPVSRGVCVCVCVLGTMVLEANHFSQLKHKQNTRGAAAAAVGKHNNIRRASLTPWDSRHTLYTRWCGVRFLEGLALNPALTASVERTADPRVIFKDHRPRSEEHIRPPLRVDLKPTRANSLRFTSSLPDEPRK